MALNKNNSAVKRIMQEARELANDPCTDYSAAPLEDDIFEWHCTLRGPAGTEFEGGLYHFRILLPAEYPFRPPSIMLLTPNGRFELNTKICISFTSYHEEMWQPAWGVRTAILGLQGFFPLKGQAAVGVGSIEYPASERKRLAVLSRDWICPHCQQKNIECLPDPPIGGSTSVAEGSSSNVAESETPASTQSSSPAPARPLESNVSESAIPTLVSEPEADVAATTSSEETEPTTPAHIAPSDTRAGRPADSLLVTGVSPTTAQALHRSPTTRPPLLLDTVICVLLVLVFALVCRKIL
ncbi:hypothetical protein PLICRDRAFT_159917 [Plicaturopsis crispa FD-325 SS-3]|nr:hypothetical protein PLICRDRAFT_159917 [Plicaturopsis crispa FD-325 SS-3]